MIVDHRLRPESTAEAALTLERLGERGIAARLLTLRGLDRGPALAERARRARYAALLATCRDEGIVQLLLAHHARDQAETVLMRRHRRSGEAGLAGMAAVSELECVRLLRPLLSVAPARLRATLEARGIAWIDDPSNRDPAALRARLRSTLDDADVAALIAQASEYGRRRAERERAIAAVLAERASIHPEGFAVLSPEPLPPEALAALLQAIAGHPYAPPLRQVAPLAAAPRPATLGGVRIMPAGRLAAGLLVVREAAAQSPPVPARPGARWDGRFRFGARAKPPDGAVLGALGAVAARLRDCSPLPAAVLQALPAVWRGAALLAIPHLAYPDEPTCRDLRLAFCPRRPAAGAAWLVAPPARTPRAGLAFPRSD